MSHKRYLGLSTLGIVLLIVLILLLVGVFPVFPHAAGWGYGPSSFVAVLLVVLIVLLVLGKL